MGWCYKAILCVLGRIHAAAISGIDTDKKLISVEWFENDETKGKEVSVLYLELRVKLVGRLQL